MIITRSTDAATITPDQVIAPAEFDNEAQAVVHWIVGRSAPDVTLRPAHSASGTLALLFASAAAAEAARTFHQSAATFTTTGAPAWMPAVYVPTDSIHRAQLDDVNGGWRIDIPIQEISA